ncbi:MAG: fibronectin type III domain-containing protein [Bdellovibrionota bacterium]
MKTAQIKLVLTAIVATAFIACSQDKPSNPEDGTSKSSSVNLSKYDVNSFPLNKLVCDPFGGGGGPETPQNGIKATLFYRGLNAPRYYRVMDYINSAVKSDQTLFFNRVDVPTRMFTEGFPLQTGGKVKDDSGSQLIEYFALKMETTLQLTADDQEGDYELALLSDDGTILKIQDPATGANPAWETLVLNDGDSPTRMGCSSRVVRMTRDKKIPLQLYYYQGPRYHISNMLIWRKSLTAGQDADCGKFGNNFYFDPNNNSNPLEWINLTLRGWKVIQDANYLLPQESSNQTNGDANIDDVTPQQNYNACFEGQIPKIDNLKVDQVTLTDIFLSWTTDIPSTAQAIVINTVTGDKFITISDNVLRTAHTVHVSGLSPGTTYRLQAVSVSQDLGKGISSAIEVTTFTGSQ